MAVGRTGHDRVGARLDRQGGLQACSAQLDPVQQHDAPGRGTFHLQRQPGHALCQRRHVHLGDGEPGVGQLVRGGEQVDEGAPALQRRGDLALLLLALCQVVERARGRLQAVTLGEFGAGFLVVAGLEQRARLAEERVGQRRVVGASYRGHARCDKACRRHQPARPTYHRARVHQSAPCDHPPRWGHKSHVRGAPEGGRVTAWPSRGRCPPGIEAGLEGWSEVERPVASPGRAWAVRRSPRRRWPSEPRASVPGAPRSQAGLR